MKRKTDLLFYGIGALTACLFCAGVGLLVNGLGILKATPTSVERLAPVELSTATRTIVWHTPIPQPTFTRVPTFTPYGWVPCDCRGADLDCPDFADSSTAQRCYDHCWSQGLRDIFRLDRDGDGLVCEPPP